MNMELFIVPFFGNWAIRQSGKEHPISTHNKKEEAIKFAEQLTKRFKCPVTILEQDIMFNMVS